MEMNKPILQIKFVGQRADEIDTAPISSILTVLKNLGYYPIITGKEIDISTLDVTAVIAYIGGTPITVKDILAAKIAKSDTFEDEIELEIRLDAAKNIKEAADFINNINAKIQLLFPDNSEVYSAIKLDDDWMEKASVDGSISANIYTTNSFFKGAIAQVTANVTDGDQILNVLDDYLEEQINRSRENSIDPPIVSKSGIPNNVMEPIDNSVKPVSIDEIAEDLNLPSREELKTAAKNLKKPPVDKI